jgi:hypothetical protein
MATATAEAIMDFVTTLLQKLTLDSTVEDSTVNAYWRGLMFPLSIGIKVKNWQGLPALHPF